MSCDQELNTQSYLDGELQGAHAGAALEALDFAGVATAINAIVSPVVCTERVDPVVEHVESIEHELGPRSLRDSETL